MLHGTSKTVSHVSFLSQPFIELQIGDGPAALGAAARKAIVGSKTGVPDPDWWATSEAEFVRPFAVAMGFRSMKSLMQGAAECDLAELDDGSFDLASVRPGGIFTPPIRISATASDEELGAAILAALDRSASLRRPAAGGR